MALIRTSFLFLAAWPLLAECRVPDLAPGAVSRLTALELVDTGHFLRAEKALSMPATPQEQWLLSKTKAALGKLDEAMTLAEAALAADPNNAAYHVQVAAVSGRLAEKATFLKKLAYVRRAKLELDAAAALDTKNTEAQWGLMMYFYAAPALVGGDKAKAQQIGEQLATAVPDLGRYYQGRLAEELKDLEKAEAFYKQSAGENPMLFDTISALAMHYMRTKADQPRAERWACQAVHSDPVRGEAWALLARAYTMCGCWDKAVNVAKMAEDADPDNLAPWFALGEAAVERGEQTEPAIDWMKKYLEHPIEGNQPGEAVARMHLAELLVKAGKQADALPELKAAIELDPTLDSAKTELKKLTSDIKNQETKKN